MSQCGRISTFQITMALEMLSSRRCRSFIWRFFRWASFTSEETQKGQADVCKPGPNQWVALRLTSPLGSRHYLLILHLVSQRFLHGFGRQVPEGHDQVESGGGHAAPCRKNTRYSRRPVLQDERCGGQGLKLQVPPPPRCRQGDRGTRRDTCVSPHHLFLLILRSLKTEEHV